MIRFLKWIPYRYHAWLLDHGWLVPALGVFILFAGPLYYFNQPAPYEVVGFQTADVLFANDATSETGYRMQFSVRLPDGTTRVLGTQSLQLATQVTETACLEVRHHITGETSYVLTNPEYCAVE